MIIFYQSCERLRKDDDFNLSCIIKPKPDSAKMQKVLRSGSRGGKEAEERGDLLRTRTRAEKSQGDQNSRTDDTGCRQHKRWTKKILQKEALLAFFNGSKLLDDFDHDLLSKKSKMPIPNHCVDLLTANPSEIRKNLKPEQLHDKKNPKNDFFELLQHEICHLREKFELNDRNYQIEDLMVLTVSSKNILKLESLQNNTEYDLKIGDSVYHDLECHRMALEKKIGFSSFSKAYGKMIQIINDELDSFLKNFFEKENEPTKASVIKNVQVSGDNDDLIKNTWKSIIDVLGDKQEYLPDIWELTMSENICYHF